MRNIIRVFSTVAFTTLATFSYATTYVDTSGKKIEEKDLGPYCRPTWKLDGDKVMVFSTSAHDVSLLKSMLIDSGMTDTVRLSRWIKSAQNNDCTSRAGLNCSGGKCSSGTCQLDTNKNGNACLCK